MSDESLREIHVSGKQLVFAFMAATAVAVVIFLTGVMVGRGVPAATALALTVPSEAPFAAEFGNVPEAAAVSDSGTIGSEDVSYPDALLSPEPPPELLEEPVRESRLTDTVNFDVPDVQPVPVLTAPLDAPTLAGGEPAVSAAGDSNPRPVLPRNTWREPDSDGFVVQVAAVSQRSEAEVIAADLDAKGYQTFIASPDDGAARIFRVRVGKFADRAEAEIVAGRLAREERFEPWITR